MQMIKAFNETIRYIESELDGEIDEGRVAVLSSYSYAMFSRLFSILTNMTLSEYIRLRKLTKAAMEINGTDTKIIDIAMKYGYESPDSFTNAFKSFHHVTPTEVRNGEAYRVVSPIQLTLSVKGGKHMDVKIQKKHGFAVAGVKLDNIESSSCPTVWDQLYEKYDYGTLSRMGSGQSYGMCFDVENPSRINYMACYHVGDVSKARKMGLEVMEIKEAEYAIENGLSIDYVLVYKLSRFGRNAADILNSLEFIQSYGINLICIEEGIDSSQTSGKLLISVLSAVAEIERENILEQTMNGRREKARQGGWNGGFAPYGYYLKDNHLYIEETEAEAVRIIYDMFGNSDIGYGGIAKYLNLQGIRKIPRQNGKLDRWSGHFVRLILDNPVYCGKIAYGRRTREKVKGTKNDYHLVNTDDYILEDGQHEGIVSEELWNKVHAKRVATGVKQPSKVGKDRAHLLTGILKCPKCGSSMYTNKHAWTNKDGTYKEVYYYVCGRNKQERGQHCDYKASLRKTDIEPLVIEAVKELVRDEFFVKEIKKRIGHQIDTSKIDREITNYENKLREVDLNKTRLEQEIDSLPADVKYRERKIHDMTLRLDGLYEVIVDLETRIEDARLRRAAVETEAISLENLFKIMQNFGELYAIISDEERKAIISYLIKEIQIYPHDEAEQPLKSIEFNFPVYRDGQEIKELLWEKGNTVETVVLMSRVKD